MVIATRGFPQLAFGMDWTQGATVATDHVDHDEHVEEVAGIAVPVVMAHTEQDHDDAPVSQMQDSLVPSLLPRQIAVTSAFVATHVVTAGEKLGQIAERYSVSVMTIVAANDIDTKMLAIGQQLRIPRVSGLPHVVAEGETVESISEQYNVPSSTIRFFASNNLGSGRAVLAGEEIFIPGAVAIGNGPTEAEASEATAVPVGTVLDDETRIRTGPSTDFDKIAKLGGDTQIALLGRHENWFKIRTPNGTEGWIAADLLGVSDGVADQVPQVVEVPSLPLVQVQPAEPQPEPAAQPKQEPKPEPKPAPKAEPKPDTGSRWVWPAAGDLTSGFGYRNFRVGRFHNGIDIANRKGTAIRAARAGRVIAAGWCSGYGYCVKINHGDGLVTEYGHLASQPNVRVGNQVSAGERIGSMGSTFDRRGGGYSTGVHLHFTVKRHGKAVNPMRYLP
jgi:murein DD-endopeptidase MepM/ murein hydrolase activator NlpD